jgi:hypothetical protein
VIEAERIEVEFSADIFGGICAQDVESEASEAGEGSGVCANSALIFAEGHISDVVVAVLDGPMAADGGACRGGGHRRLTGVERGFGGLMPEAGLCVLVPGQAAHPGGGDDQSVPIGPEATADIEGFDETVLLPAMFLAIDGFGAVGRRPGGAQGFERFVQGLLVGLDLGDEDISGVPGRLKCFFDSAWRRP